MSDPAITQAVYLGTLDAHTRIRELEAEVERLRAALRRIRYVYDLYRDSPPVGMDEFADDLVGIARAALAGE